MYTGIQCPNDEQHTAIMNSDISRWYCFSCRSGSNKFDFAIVLKEIKRREIPKGYDMGNKNYLALDPEYAKRNRDFRLNDPGCIEMLKSDPNLEIDENGFFREKGCRVYRDDNCSSWGTHTLLCDCDKHKDMVCDNDPGCKGYEKRMNDLKLIDQ